MKPFKFALLFTGHMIDLPEREVPRFPPAREPAAREAVENCIASAKAASQGSLLGIASGARGGDILFLEGCRQAGVPFRMILPFAVERFLDSSVRGVAGGNWEARFQSLWGGLASGHREILRAPAGANPYDFCNRRMLALARKLAQRFSLVALWDGKDTELKPGGTATFVALVKESGGQFTHIDIEMLPR